MIKKKEQKKKDFESIKIKKSESYYRKFSMLIMMTKKIIKLQFDDIAENFILFLDALES